MPHYLCKNVLVSNWARGSLTVRIGLYNGARVFCRWNFKRYTGSELLVHWGRVIRLMSYLRLREYISRNKTGPAVYSQRYMWW